MMARISLIICLIGALVIASSTPTAADPNVHDIASGGLATISSTAFGGSVVSNPSLNANLAVTVNFGEISPINTAPFIRATIPVAIRSRENYQITVTISGTVSADPNAVKLSDIGFGIQNLRSLGSDARPCGINSIIRSPFNNNPSTSVTINPTTGRAQYPSSLANIVGSTIVINGPRLTRNRGGWGRDNDNGYVFDAILVIVPQWYTVGNISLTLTFRMSSGPNFNCP